VLYEDDLFNEFKEAFEKETMAFEKNFKKECDKNVILLLMCRMKRVV